MNEETVVLVSTAIVIGYLGTLIRGPYRDWADGHINRIKDILQSSRKEHTDAVRSRIESVQKMQDVVDITKGLFELSKVGIQFV